MSDQVPLRIGILGAARIAPMAVIAPAAKTGAAVVSAIAARDPARAQSFAAEHGIPAVADDYEALIARDDVDVVYVALPASLHTHWTLSALSAEKHVLVEKPAAIKGSDAAIMVRVAMASGVRLIEAFHYRYHPLMDRVIEIMQSGVLGEIEAFDARFNAPVNLRPDDIRWDPDLGGGALYDLGTYPVHWARTILQGEPKILSAVATVTERGVDQAMDAALMFHDRISATIGCDMAPADGKFSAWMKITGTAGELFVVNPLAPQMGHAITLVTPDGTKTETVPEVPTYEYQMRHVMGAIRNGTPVPTEGADLRAQATVLEAIYAAAAGE